MSESYRIRYRPDGLASPTREMVVEASSPTEAMVKFHHVCQPQKADGRPNANRRSDWRGNDEVVSVCVDPPCDDHSW